MKKAFNLTEVLERIEKAVAPHPKAAMFDLYEKGFSSLFEQLISCIISIRTLDETTLPVSKRLFAQTRIPQQILALPERKLEQLLYGSSFPGQKATTKKCTA